TSYLHSTGVKRLSVEYVPDFTRSLVHYLKGVELEVVTSSLLKLELEDAVLFASKGVRLTCLSDNSLVDVKYVNPLTVEKTIIFELYESGIKADYVVVPAETDLLALSLHKGLKDLEEAGIDFNCEIVAVKIKGSSAQLLEGLKLDSFRVVEISEEEAYESLRELVKRGFRIKPIVALSYSVAKIAKDAIAIVTMGLRAPSKTERSAVKRMILEVLAKKRPLTAYQIWKEKPSLHS
ncbi:MAG: hypothetical protein QXT15_06475, partial [Desulfurococcaceae archaeon]